MKKQILILFTALSSTLSIANEYKCSIGMEIVKDNKKVMIEEQIILLNDNVKLFNNDEPNGLNKAKIGVHIRDYKHMNMGNLNPGKVLATIYLLDNVPKDVNSSEDNTE